MSAGTPRRFAASVDVGGTFTDVISVDLDTGETTAGKHATVSDSPAQGIVEALSMTGVELSEVERFIHGTTIGINTLLQRRGDTVGFITSEGFRDLLQMGDGSWPAFRLTWEPPRPLTGRRMCREVPERIRADGTTVTQLSVDDVVAEAKELVAQGARAIAICFVNAYAWPRHEQLAADAVRAAFPDVDVVASHELSRRFREFARAQTVVGEAYLRPTMRAYFDRLESGLHDAGFAGRTYITSSDGGVMSLELARDRALRSLVSGCASGIAGAAVAAAHLGISDLLAIDMGGTSFDAALVRGGQPSLAPVAEVDGQRFLVPMLELATIGAGGGSIASVDPVSGLEVGPRSAGSKPGPVCYGRGGTEPTFTDAALVCGLLPASLVEGQVTLDGVAAREALARHVAQPLGISTLAAAAGITQVVEAKMAGTLKEMTVGHGLDPREFTIFAYGGNGPLVAANLATDLGVRRVVVPENPGVFSAWGMQTLDLVHEFSQTLIVDVDTASEAELRAPLEGIKDQAVEALVHQGVSPDDVVLLSFVEMRYEGQEHTLLVPFVEGGAAALRAAFDQEHHAAFGFQVSGSCEIFTYRVRAIGRLSKPPTSTAARGASTHRPTGTRLVAGRSGELDEWSCWSRTDLAPGSPVVGPAIVEELTATTVVPRGWTAHVDENGYLVIES